MIDNDPAGPSVSGQPTPAPGLIAQFKAALNAPPPDVVDALAQDLRQARAKTARLRSQLAEAREAHNLCARDRIAAEAERDEARSALAAAVRAGKSTSDARTEYRRELEQAQEELRVARSQLAEAREQRDEVLADIRRYDTGLARERDSLREERDRLVAEVRRFAGEPDEASWALLAARLRTLGLPGLGDDPAEITDRVCRWLATLHEQAATQARVIVQYSSERDEARAERDNEQALRNDTRLALIRIAKAQGLDAHSLTPCQIAAFVEDNMRRLAEISAPEAPATAQSAASFAQTGSSTEPDEDNPPPVGEGAALIAATEAEIADMGDEWIGVNRLASQRDRWAETARILARALDDRPPAPVQPEERPDGDVREARALHARAWAALQATSTPSASVPLAQLARAHDVLVAALATAEREREALRTFRVEVATALGWSDGESDETLLDSLRKNLRLRDAHAQTVNRLAAEVQTLRRYDESAKAIIAELRTILGAKGSEYHQDAARRVVSERNREADRWRAEAEEHAALRAEVERIADECGVKAVQRAGAADASARVAFTIYDKIATELRAALGSTPDTGSE